MGGGKEVTESKIPVRWHLPELSSNAAIELDNFRLQRIDHFKYLPNLNLVLKSLAQSRWPPDLSLMFKTLEKAHVAEIRDANVIGDLQKLFGGFVSRTEMFATNPSLKNGIDEVCRLRDFCNYLSKTSLQLGYLHKTDYSIMIEET